MISVIFFKFITVMKYKTNLVIPSFHSYTLLQLPQMFSFS